MNVNLSKLSYFIRCCIHTIATLIGMRRDIIEWRFDGLITAGWVFLLGLPIGTIVLGSSFSLLLWSIIVVLTTMLVNADDAIYFVLWLKENNLDGEVKENVLDSNRHIVLDG